MINMAENSTSANSKNNKKIEEKKREKRRKDHLLILNIASSYDTAITTALRGAMQY